LNGYNLFKLVCMQDEVKNEFILMLKNREIDFDFLMVWLLFDFVTS